MLDMKEILRLHSEWLRGHPGGKKAVLSRSDLSYIDLSRSDLRYIDLTGSDLRGSDLTGSDLSFIDLRGSDLRGSDLTGSDLRGSDLRGAVVNWDSHDLISHILLSHAGTDVEKRKLAGLILVSRDWCWKKFLSLGDPLTEWALSVLRQYETPENPLPLED